MMQTCKPNSGNYRHLNVANQTTSRLSQLLKIQGISRQDYDLAVLNANSTQADMEIVRTNIARTVVRAPFSGKLGLKGISIGTGNERRNVGQL